MAAHVHETKGQKTPSGKELVKLYIILADIDDDTERR